MATVQRCGQRGARGIKTSAAYVFPAAAAKRAGPACLMWSRMVELHIPAAANFPASSRVTGGLSGNRATSCRRRQNVFQKARAPPHHLCKLVAGGDGLRLSVFMPCRIAGAMPRSVPALSPFLSLPISDSVGSLGDGSSARSSVGLTVLAVMRPPVIGSQSGGFRPTSIQMRIRHWVPCQLSRGDPPHFHHDKDRLIRSLQRGQTAPRTGFFPLWVN